MSTIELADYWWARAKAYAAVGDTRRAEDCAQIARELLKPTN